MHLNSGREFDFVSHLTNLSFNLERSKAFRAQLLVRPLLHINLSVSLQLNQHLIPNSISHVRPVLISKLFHPILSFLKLKLEFLDHLLPMM